MSLRKIVHNQINVILNESIGDESILFELINSMSKNGIEIISIDEIEYNNNIDVGAITIQISSKESNCPLIAFVEIAFYTKEKGYKRNAIIGSTPETSYPSYGEPSKFLLELKYIEVIDRDSDETLYKGKDPFLIFFENNYNFFYSNVADELNDATDEDSFFNEIAKKNNFENFIKEELYKLQTKMLIEVIIKSNDGFQTEDVELSGTTIIVNGIEKLRKVVEIFKSHNLIIKFSFGSHFVNKEVIGISNTGIETESGILIEFENLIDDFGEIWYLTYGNDNAFIDFRFTDAEKKSINNNNNNMELATQDFETLTTNDEREMYESRSLKTFIKEEIYKLKKKQLSEAIDTNVLMGNELKIASGNPLNGKSKQSAISLIYKIYHQIDHGQLYKDEAWENVHKIFNLFRDYNIDMVGGYDAEYSPNEMNIDVMKSKWKKWNLDFNYIDKNAISRTITFLLEASAAGSIEEPWKAYDLAFYPILK
jgi:hypothetical protein